MHNFNSNRNCRNIPSVAGPIGHAAVVSGSSHMSNTRAHSTRVWARGCASWPLISQAGGVGLPKLSPRLLHFWVKDKGVMAAPACSSPRLLKKTFASSWRSSCSPLQPEFYPDKTQGPSNITGLSRAQSPGNPQRRASTQEWGKDPTCLQGHTGSASSSWGVTSSCSVPSCGPHSFSQNGEGKQTRCHFSVGPLAYW